MHRVFLSYRREDAATAAGRIHDLLTHRFGEDRVFMDVYALEGGTDFKETIAAHLKKCQLVLVIIGRRWLEITGPNGKRRLDDPGDLVRFEIETALTHGVAVVPVLVEGASMPAEASLPQTIAPLARLHALSVDNSHFPRDAARLVRTVRNIARGWPARIWFDWRFAAVAALAVIGTSLHIMKVPQAEAEINVAVSQFGFRLRRPDSVLAGLRVSRLGVAGLSEAVFPGRGPVSTEGVQLESLSAHEGAISIPSLIVPGGTQVWYRREAPRRELIVGLRGSPLQFEVSVLGRVRIGFANAGSFTEDFSTPETVAFRAGPEEVDLLAADASPPSGELVRQAPADRIWFVELEHSEAGGGPFVRRVSSVRKGALVFFPPDGPRSFLKSGDLLGFDVIRGQIRTVALDGDGFSVRFTGVLRGAESNARNLMPSWLQSALARARGSLD